jgi:hypothetical protein
VFLLDENVFAQIAGQASPGRWTLIYVNEI